MNRNEINLQHPNSQKHAALRISIQFDGVVDVAHEFQRRKERHGSEHQEEYVAGEERVAEELDHLQRPRHARALEVIEHGIDKDEDPGRPGRKHKHKHRVVPEKSV